MDNNDKKFLQGLICVIRNHKEFSDEDMTLLKKIKRIINEKWITIHPHGDDSDDYRRIKLEDGESPKEAIDRVYKKGGKGNKQVDINTLIKQRDEIKTKLYRSGVSFNERMKLQEKSFELEQQIKKIETKNKADKIGGYTKKLNDLCEFTQLSDLSSYPIELQKHIYNNYKTVYSKYPQIKYGGLQVQKLADKTYAQNLSKSNIITLNSKKYSDLKSLKESYDNTVKNQYHPQGTDYNSIIVHELGHGLQQYIEKKYKITAPEIRATVLKNIGIKQKDIPKYLSIYATEKSKLAREFFAEAFAEYMTSKHPRPLAKEFGKEINRILKNY